MFSGRRSRTRRRHLFCSSEDLMRGNIFQMLLAGTFGLLLGGVTAVNTIADLLMPIPSSVSNKLGFSPVVRDINRACLASSISVGRSELEAGCALALSAQALE